MTDASATTLVLQNVMKSYGSTRALRDVSLSFEAGEIHTVLGENGSGKSTLVKILSGIASKDSGELTLDGRPITCTSPTVSRADGIATVFQELTFVPSLTLAENVFLGSYKRHWTGVLDSRLLNRRCDELMDELGFDLDGRQPASELSLAQLQLAEFARAYAREPRVLILDEATSALDQPEAAALIGNLRKLTSRGTTVIFVSHRLDEVIEVSDRISTLVDGRIVSTRQAGSVSRESLLNELLGNTIDSVRDVVQETAAILKEATHEAKTVLFECEIPASAGFRSDIRITARRGEIVGLAGLQGHGQKRALRIIGGDLPASGMRRTLADRPVTGRSPRDAIAAGIYYIPEERKIEGIVTGHPVAANLVLSSLPLVSRWGWLRRALEHRVAEEMCTRLGVRLASVRQPIDSLSGGNQQKVVLGRGLLCEPQLLLLDDSMRGIDVRAKNEIYQHLVDFTEAGAAVLLNSTEIPELIRLCSRVIVFHDQDVSAELTGDDVNEAAVLRAMFGQRKAPAA
ncbi:MAG: sugar transporter ATP-binding protein [Marmoricola sp.]|nr:sugar transporter ATP-binding protein [Marmoricola sp.]